MIIETFLDASHLTNNQSLVIVDDSGKRWDVVEALASSQETPAYSNPNELILERWRVELGEAPAKFPPDLASILPTVYKKSIVLFRSLFTYSKFLPAWKLAKRSGKTPAKALKVRFRIREARLSTSDSRPDSLTIPLYPGSGQVLGEYSFGTTESPAGPFSVQVTYRINCDFRVDDAEAILSSRFMGADDQYFRPSIPSEETSKVSGQEAGSMPLSRRGIDNPDRTRAYGSLSTFHQIGPTTGASPISTLRAARELGTTSPSPPASPPQRLLPAAKISSLGRAALTGADDGSGMVRRPSVSFQPFKAPPLSASPSLVDAPNSASPRLGSTRPLSMGAAASARNTPPPGVASSVGHRKPMAAATEQAISSSTSASPKAAPISRYSSSFSHRRGRLSSGGPSKTDEDNNSSGKGSTASSNVQPGSGILAEATGTSADSLHADDENISDFLKMLDTKKDLLNPVKAAAVDAATRRTSAALSRFHRMRDSNAALSDSMSSSLFLNRSSTTSSSRQLSSVPPMVTGTSTSTASSPGKQISPHTPHTPAIPSRLSSNSIISYNEPTAGRSRRRSNLDRESPAEDTASEETALRPTVSGVNAIDIPKSPRPFGPSYRRSSSAAQRRPTAANEDDELFPFGMRSVSLGAEDRSQLSLSALVRQQEFESATTTAEPSSPDPRQSSPANADSAAPSLPTSNPYPEVGEHPSGTAGGPKTTSTSGNQSYQPRFSTSRGRGSSAGPQSHSSTSSGNARGNPIPAYLTERDRDRDPSGSGSNSGNSTMDIRRGTGYRSASGRPPGAQAAPFDEEEPLLFAMSDFGASRRSLEEGRRGSVGNESGGTSGGSRRGSGRRGGGMPSFHAWQ